MDDVTLSTRLASRSAHRIVLSGCSGGGKSSLLEEIGRRGFNIVPEPGRRVVREQLLIDGEGLPWRDLTLFVELTVSRAIGDAIAALDIDGPSFFDRSVVDQMAGLETAGLPVPSHIRRAAAELRYDTNVFLVPPWPEIYRTDSECQQGFDDAVRQYETLCVAYDRLGYTGTVLPRVSIEERADIVLKAQKTGR